MTAPDPIDALVSEQLTQQPHIFVDEECPLGRHPWHGLAHTDCPGPYGGPACQLPTVRLTGDDAPLPEQSFSRAWEVAAWAFNTGWTVVDYMRSLWRQR